MYLKESEEMIYTACTHYDMEMQNGKLGTDRVYEGSYEQAFDTVVDELEKREKEIEELKDIKADYIRRMESSNKMLLKQGYISKDKIREKIEELKKVKGDFATYIATRERIAVLEELLEGD